MQSFEKNLLKSIVLLSVIISGCKESSDKEVFTQIENQDGIQALVTAAFYDQGCEVLLEIEENGEKVLLLPIELDDKFKIHGTRLSIEFHSSKVMQSNCQKGRPIVIDRVNLVEKNRVLVE